MDNRATMVTWEVDTASLTKAQVKLVNASVAEVQAWILHWPGLVPAITAAPIRLNLAMGEEFALKAEADESGVVVSVSLSRSMLAEPVSNVRRHLIDAMLEAAKLAGQLRPNDVPVEVDLNDGVTPPSETASASDVLSTEIAFLTANQLLVLQHLGPADTMQIGYQQTDDAFIDHIGNLKTGVLLETTALAQTVVWVMATDDR